jgi:hypothetical protein
MTILYTNWFLYSAPCPRTLPWYQTQLVNSSVDTSSIRLVSTEQHWGDVSENRKLWDLSMANTPFDLAIKRPLLFAYFFFRKPQGKNQSEIVAGVYINAFLSFCLQFLLLYNQLIISLHY